jgi:hypothetical protein
LRGKSHFRLGQKQFAAFALPSVAFVGIIFPATHLCHWVSEKACAALPGMNPAGQDNRLSEVRSDRLG